MSIVNPSRARGSLLGLAVGDALGAIIEFKLPGSFEPVAGMRKGETWSIPLGAYTDDTSQALCLARSLVEVGFDTSDLLNRYVSWWKDGYLSSTGECFDIGVGTRGALESWVEHGSDGDQFVPESSAGAGSISRLAPLAIWAAHRPELGQMARKSAATTHGAREAIDGAWYFAEMLRGALTAPDDAELAALKQQALHPDLERFEQCDPRIASLAEADLEQKVASDFRDDGYVVTCLESALWALATTDSFESGMLAAVNLGRDADTRSAVYGQLAGAIYGVEAIPDAWIDGLLDAEMIDRLAGELMTSPVRSDLFEVDGEIGEVGY